MGTNKTNKQTDKRRDKQTDKSTNIYSIFRDKLSLPEGSSDTAGTYGQSVVKCWPLSLTWWESAEKQIQPKRIRPRKNLGGGIRFINKHWTMLTA
jgi:hypothetical protein